MYIMGEEPMPGISPTDIKEKYSGLLTEHCLADAFAIASNKFWWVEDNVYDYEEGTPEYQAACEITDAWGELMDYYKSQIFTILQHEGVTIPETGQIAVLEPFMLRNGYLDGNGWWIKVAANMVEAAKVLNEEQIKFICEECKITQKELMKLDEDGLYDVVYEKMCDIEMAEVPADDTPISDHCIMASDIVTILGNALAMSEGFYAEQLSSNDEADGE